MPDLIPTFQSLQTLQTIQTFQTFQTFQTIQSARIRSSQVRGAGACG